MIRRIRLRSWKAFDDLTLELERGTSFIVASNGVGKTSLLQAIHFGIFGGSTLLGSGTPILRAIRGSADAAFVGLDVDLGSRAWVITRSVIRMSTRAAVQQTVEVVCDGERVGEAAWNEALEQSSGVGMTELRLLSAIGEGSAMVHGNTLIEQYDIVRHLSDVLGVNRLRKASSDLHAKARRLGSQADTERRSVRDQPVRSAEADRATAANNLNLARQELEELRSRLAAQQTRIAYANVWAEWRRATTQSLLDVQTRQHELQQAVARVIDDVDPLFPEVDIRRLVGDLGDSSASDPWLRLEAWARAAGRANSVVVGLREELLRETGQLQAQAVFASNALELLSGEGPTCPTCRRPISSIEASAAAQEHRRALESSRERLRSVEAIAESLRRTAMRLTTLSRPPVLAPPRPAGDEVTTEPAEVVAATTPLADEVHSADARVRDLESSVRHLDETIAGAKANEGLRAALTTMYREADLLSMTGDAFRGLANEICTQRILPISETLAKRWSELWPGRPSLHLTTDTGELLGEAGGATIDVSDLSGGERAVGIVLLRLLALQSASSAPILLLDEPLEHLDSRNRRLLASLLVAATEGDTAPRQVLVTSYEESVTRRFAAPSADSRSHVVYISDRSLSTPTSS